MNEYVTKLKEKIQKIGRAGMVATFIALALGFFLGASQSNKYSAISIAGGKGIWLLNKSNGGLKMCFRRPEGIECETRRLYK